MFGCYTKKLHRLLPARDSLEASVPSFYLMVLAPGGSWGCSVEQNCLPGKGVFCLNIPLGRTQQDKEQVTSTLVLQCHHCQVPCFPLPPGPGMLWDVLWAVFSAHAHTTVVILLAQD